MIDRAAALAEELRAFKVETDDRLSRLESTLASHQTPAAATASAGSPDEDEKAPAPSAQDK